MTITDNKLVLIAKLLRKAEAAGTDEEADAFTAKAEELAATYQVDLALARSHTAQSERRKTPTMQEVEIGERGKLRNKGLCALMIHIALAYGLKLDVAHNNTRVYLYGFDTDIELVQALYASLSVQMISAGDRFIRNREFAGETVWDERSWEYKRVSARGARQAFHDAFASRVGSRLQLRIARARSNYAPTDRDTAASTALVLRTAELEVIDYHKEHSNARGNWRGSKAQSERAASAGRRAGDNARLGGERAIGGHRTEVSA